jgi:phosphoesterase RecJ-like protein
MTKLTFDALCDRLAALAGKKVLILTHRSPDPDAFGSAFALVSLIRAMGGSADVLCDGSMLPRLHFIGERPSDGGPDDVPLDTPSFAAVSADALRAMYDAVVATDTASPSQLGRFEPYAPAVDFALDHHGSGEPFCDLYVDASAAASGEIVYDCGIALESSGRIKAPERAAAAGHTESAGRAEAPERKDPPSRASALPLEFFIRVYAAISADTGCFRFSNVTPGTHRRASEILARMSALGESCPSAPDAAEINRLIFDSPSAAELAARRLVLDNMRFFCGGRLCGVLVTQEEMAALGVTEADMSEAPSLVRAVDGVEIGFTVRGTEDPGVWRVSARSNGEANVAAVCASFGGGGHMRAAGCALRAPDAQSAFDLARRAFAAALVPPACCEQPAGAKSGGAVS